MWILFKSALFYQPKNQFKNWEKGRRRKKFPTSHTTTCMKMICHNNPPQRFFFSLLPTKWWIGYLKTRFFVNPKPEYKILLLILSNDLEKYTTPTSPIEFGKTKPFAPANKSKFRVMHLSYHYNIAHTSLE